MPLKEIAVHQRNITGSPRCPGLDRASSAMHSAVDSQLRLHPLQIGSFLKLNVMRGNESKLGLFPLFEEFDRIATVHLPAEPDDIVGLPALAQADVLLDVLVERVTTAAA